VIIDASVWISYFNTQDVNHEITTRWLDPLLGSGRPIYAPTLLPVEVSGAITRMTGNSLLGSKAAAEILDIGAVEVVPLDQALMETAVDVACSVALKGADAVYVATAISVDQPLVTWDRQMLDRPSGLVPTYSPASLVEGRP
jgi:predicted nucleic acid-binding protein